MKQKCEILMIGDISPGGMSSVVKQYFDNGLSEDIIFLPTYKGGSFLFKIGYFGKFLLKYSTILITNPDIKLIHIHASNRGSYLRKGLASYIGKLFNKKTILHIHGSEFNVFYEKLPFFLKIFMRNLLNKSNMIFALSKQWKIDIASKCNNKNIRVLYNPTRLNEINNKNSRNINVLFMGRIGARKGAYDIVEAAKYINNRNIKINLYGNGDVEQIKNLVAEHKLESIVKVNGWISGDQINQVFKEADICILPTYHEGLPMFILEAMGHGLPVISTPVGGIPDSIVDGVNGYLINPGDSMALAQKIEILASDSKLRQKMGQEGYRIAKEKFEVSNIINELREIYRELIN